MTKVGFSKMQLDQLHNKMQGYVDQGEVPGIVTLLSRPGETHIDALGDSIGRDSIFRITSMTKPITAAATMTLLEEKKLRLDDPIEKWLPELSNRQVLKKINGPLNETVPANRPITVEDLLTFRSGFGFIMGSSDEYPILKAAEEAELVGLGPPNPSAPYSPDEWIRRLGKLPLMAQPGERWMYNTAYYILGVLIGRLAGVPLEKFFHQRIFEPLGMKDTSFSVPSEKLDRFTNSYWFDSENKKLELFDGITDSQWAHAPAFPDAAAGLVSTIEDYFLFSQMLLGFGKTILSRTSIETMTTDHLTPAQKALPTFSPDQWESHGYGFGVSVVTGKKRPTEPVGQYGWDGGFGSSWRSDPKEKMTGIILTARTFDSPNLPPVCVDFWNGAYDL